MHIDYEQVIAYFCIVFGVILQWKMKKTDSREPLVMGLTDMQILGLMMWVAGAILLMDCHWHFLTEPEH